MKKSMSSLLLAGLLLSSVGFGGSVARALTSMERILLQSQLMVR